MSDSATLWTLAWQAPLQARILEWATMPFSRGSSWLRDWTQASYVSWQAGYLILVPPEKPTQCMNVGNTFSRVGNGNPLQYSCLENSTGRGAWCATVYAVTKGRAQLSTEHVCTHTHTHTHTRTHISSKLSKSQSTSPNLYQQYLSGFGLGFALTY